MNIMDIAKEYLGKSIFDGLVNDAYNCCCGINDLCPDPDHKKDCIPVYKTHILDENNFDGFMNDAYNCCCGINDLCPDYKKDCIPVYKTYKIGSERTSEMSNINQNKKSSKK